MKKTSNEMIRAFIAIELPEQIHDNLRKLQDNLKEPMPDVRWIKYGNVHLTLKFLGDIESKRVDKIIKSIMDITEHFPSFTASLSGIGAFPNSRKPSIIWAGIDKGFNVISEIAREIESSMEKLGFPREKRPFKPHLTIGRVREIRHADMMAESLENLTIDDIGEFAVEKVSLIKSQLDPAGSIYTILGEALLEGRNNTNNKEMV